MHWLWPWRWAVPTRQRWKPKGWQDRCLLQVRWARAQIFRVQQRRPRKRFVQKQVSLLQLWQAWAHCSPVQSGGGWMRRLFVTWLPCPPMHAGGCQEVGRWDAKTLTRRGRGRRCTREAFSARGAPLFGPARSCAHSALAQELNVATPKCTGGAELYDGGLGTCCGVVAETAPLGVACGGVVAWPPSGRVLPWELPG